MSHVEDLEMFVRDAQDSLWTDLDDDLRQAINGSWSMAAADRCRRIIRAARLVGPTPWQEVPTSLAFGGVWHALLDIAGIDHDDITPQQEADTVALFGRQPHGSPLDPSTLRDQYRATIESMRSPREYAYLTTDGGSE